MILRLNLLNSKIIFTELGIYLKTLPPLPYKVRRLPLSTKVYISNNKAELHIKSDLYKKLKLHFFDEKVS